MTTWNASSGVSRQEFLRLLGLGAGALTLGNVGLAEAAGLAKHVSGSGTTRSFTLDPAPLQLNLGGQHASTIGYNGGVPGPELRIKEGDRLRVVVNNHLPTSTSVHWHGIPIANKMDGVPGLTQPPIGAGKSYVYDFLVPVSGTYWYHSHSGEQNDRGLYGPLIVEPKQETLSYDREYVVMFDDWRDVGGAFQTHVSRSSDAYSCKLSSFRANAMGMGQGPTQPERYPLHLVNGRPPTAPTELTVKRGEVVRLRLINCGASTTYRVAIAGHRMRVVAADGQAVKPVDVDAVELGMGERYDVLIYATNPGVWQLAALVNGEGVRTRAIVRYQGSKGAPPPAAFKPGGLQGRLLNYGMLQAAAGVEVPAGKPDMVVPIELNAKFGSFWLTWNNQVVDSNKPIHIPRDQHIRFVLENGRSTLIHPIHLHGHFFQIMNGTSRGPMKDTALMYPFQRTTVDWISDNPGLWMLHCHNLYHMMGGMSLILKIK